MIKLPILECSRFAFNLHMQYQSQYGDVQDFIVHLNTAYRRSTTQTRGNV